MYYYPPPRKFLFANRNNLIVVSLFNCVAVHAQNLNTDKLQLDINPYNHGLLFIKIASQNNQNIYKLLKQ